MFGFSRGAFTVRVLANIFCLFGVPNSDRKSPSELAELSKELLAAYKKQNEALADERKNCDSPDEEAGIRVEDDGAVRDEIPNATDGGGSAASSTEEVQRQWPDLIAKCHPPSASGFDVEFVGVWDTVEALGVPFEPVKRLVNGIFDLRFPDTVPNPGIKHLYHAMALDEARHTFQVIPWHIPKGRRHGSQEQIIEQVWFPGCHSHIGGSYAKDQLAFGALRWMLEKAEDAGLQLIPEIRDEFYQQAYAHGQLLDSRSGTQAFYRYYPRILSRSQPERDANFDPIGALNEYSIHESVLDRLAYQTNGYAPIAIDVAKVKVVGNRGFQAHSRDLGQSYQSQIQSILERYVPLRRLLYLVNLLLVVVFLSFVYLMSGTSMMDSFHASEWTPKFVRVFMKCIGTIEYPFIYLFETFLPGFIGVPIAKALKSSPGALLSFATIAILVRLFTQRTVAETQRLASVAWHAAADVIAEETTQVSASESIEGQPKTIDRIQEFALKSGERYGNWVDTLDGYVHLPQFLRRASDRTWKVLIVLTVLFLATSIGYIVRGFYGKFHQYERQSQRNFPAASLIQIPETEFHEGLGTLKLKRKFDLRSPRWPTGVYLEKGKKYKLQIKKIGSWSLNSNSTFNTNESKFSVMRQVELARIERITNRKDHEFVAETSGQLFLFLDGDWSGFFSNNSGEGEITIEELLEGTPVD